MLRSSFRTVSLTAVLAAVLLLHAMVLPAAAQGYVAEDLGGLWMERPDTATQLDIETVATVPVPFDMLYFGEPLTALTVSPHGWALPGERAGVDGTEGADQDGVLAAFASTLRGTVRTWTSGEAPQRKLVIEWEYDGFPTLAQLHVDEERDVVILAYRLAPQTGGAPRPGFVARLDEPGGDRFVAPVASEPGSPPSTTLFTPRSVLFNPPDIGKDGVSVRWQDVRKESTVPDGCTKRCTYLARGRGYFHVPDRALFQHTPTGVRKQPPELMERLLAEDRETFGGERGDAGRWVRQVLDGKVLLLRADGGEPLRVWFRIVEYFSIDSRGTTLADHHVWNLRWMLSNTFPGDDPRRSIDGYYAWRASARGRLTVGKLFRADQIDDAGKQYDSGRKNEYVLWSGRLKSGTRGPLAPSATPSDGWARFTLMEDDMRVVQHAERDDLRFVADPNYVDGHYDYVIGALDNPWGWVTGRTIPALPLRDEPFDTDPGRETGPVTPR